jgi:predicted esterase
MGGTGGDAEGGSGGTVAPDAAGMGGGGGTGGTGGARSADAAVDRALDASASLDATPEAAAPSDSGVHPGGPPQRSAGCGRVNPPKGARTIMSQGMTLPFIVSLPPTYVATQPYPLVFAFHGFRLNERGCQGLDCEGAQANIGPKAILVFPKSIGPGWEAPKENLDPNVAYFQDLVALMKREYCVDENRVAVSGVSSGGQFVHALACRLGDQLWAVAPVAGIMIEKTNCRGTPAAIVIHGVSDQLKNGQEARDAFAARNGCSSTTVPDLEMMHARIAAARAAGRTDYACVDYQGCTASPVRWCEHSEPGYAGTTHGWPTFGGKLIADFLFSLK